MMSSGGYERACAGSIDSIDYTRFVPPAHHVERLHVEWFHFVVHGPTCDVMVNFSLMARGRNAPTGHVVVLVRPRGGSWLGDVHRVDADVVEIGAGRIGLRLGDASLHFDGAFHVRAASKREGVSIDLRLVPLSFACLAHNLTPEGGGGFQWVVAPRLAASGAVRVNGELMPLNGAPAYHDHNWGSPDDGDLTWDWSCSVSTDPEPWSIVVVRVLDRTRNRTKVQGVLVWEGANRRKGFRARDVSIRHHGLRRAAVAPIVPRALALFALGSATDVPAHVSVHAEADGDHLSGRITSEDVCRVLVPHLDDLGATVIHEVTGRMRMSGHIGGRSVDVEAAAFSEFVGSMV